MTCTRSSLTQRRHSHCIGIMMYIQQMFILCHHLMPPSPLQEAQYHYLAAKHKRNIMTHAWWPHLCTASDAIIASFVWNSWAAIVDDGGVMIHVETTCICHVGSNGHVITALVPFAVVLMQTNPPYPSSWLNKMYTPCTQKKTRIASHVLKHL